MLTYEEALACIQHTTPLPTVAVTRLDQALGLVLAKPMTSRCDLPRFDNSAVDGYAIRTIDLKPQGEGAACLPSLRLVGTSQAGRPFRGLVREGQAVRILTGAQVPRGIDAVVMQEHVTHDKDQLIVQRCPPPGQNIRRQGEDLRKGARMLDAGTRLRPQEIGLLASAGYREVPVYPRPTVAILSTGDEVRPPGATLTPGQIYESNSELLSALVQHTGAKTIRLGLVRDELEPLIVKIRKGLTADVLLISGGVSVGDKDFVRRAAKRCGIQTIFWRVNIKPGMPLFFGTRGRTLVFGLPGNPVSVFVTFEEFVKPALFQWMGRAWHDGYEIPAMLLQDLTVSSTRRTHFIRVRCTHHNGHAVAEPVTGQGSHQLRSLVEADGWIRMVADQGPWSVGTRVSVKGAVVA